MAVEALAGSTSHDQTLRSRVLRMWAAVVGNPFVLIPLIYTLCLRASSRGALDLHMWSCTLRATRTSLTDLLKMCALVFLVIKRCDQGSCSWGLRWCEICWY